MVDHSIQLLAEPFALDNPLGDINLTVTSAAEFFKVNSLSPFLLLKFCNLPYEGLFLVEDSPLVDALVQNVEELNVVATLVMVDQY